MSRAHELDEETLPASQEELDSEATEKRQRAKEAVDAASRLIVSLRDEIQL
jgi:hypothetical protein